MVAVIVINTMTVLSECLPVCVVMSPVDLKFKSEMRKFFSRSYKQTWQVYLVYSLGHNRYDMFMTWSHIYLGCTPPEAWVLITCHSSSRKQASTGSNRLAIKNDRHCLQPVLFCVAHGTGGVDVAVLCPTNNAHQYAWPAPLSRCIRSHGAATYGLIGIALPGTIDRCT